MTCTIFNALRLAGAAQDQLEQPEVALRSMRWRLAAARDHGYLYRCNIAETLHAMSEDKLSAT